jgi:hypothetical protein
MNTLDDAWQWYLSTKRCSTLVRRLARKHWGCWDESSTLGRDDHFRNVKRDDLAEETELAEEHLADFAVFVLFSVFEGEVRELVLERTASERAAIRHPALRTWAMEFEEMLRQGSFGNLLRSIKTPEINDLVEQVNQVRRYRNWVAHGRRGDKEEAVTPAEAHRRLRSLLDALSKSPA